MRADSARPDFELQYRGPAGADSLACWLALPRTPPVDAPPLVAVHGIRRGTREQVRLYAARAAALGRVVIAPEFDAARWPRYQRAFVNGRADLALLSLMAELRLAGLWRSVRFELTGFSGGAQFAHRFAMLHPHRVARLSVAAAGWYTFPDGAPFPYGLAARPGRRDDWGPRIARRMDAFLSLPIEVCVGAYDNVSDSNTRRGTLIDSQQGTNRLARARRWVAAVNLAARERQLESRAVLRVLPGCGHNFGACVRRGGLAEYVLPLRAREALPGPGFRQAA